MTNSLFFRSNFVPASLFLASRTNLERRMNGEPSKEERRCILYMRAGKHNRIPRPMMPRVIFDGYVEGGTGMVNYRIVRWE